MIPHDIAKQIESIKGCALLLFPRGVPDEEKRTLTDLLDEVLELEARLEKVYEMRMPPLPGDAVQPVDPALVRKCSSCSAAIVWVHNAKTGKPAPLNVNPVKGLVLNQSVEVNAYGAAIATKLVYEVVDVYTNHFATCEHAARHRKAKEPKPEPAVKPPPDTYLAWIAEGCAHCGKPRGEHGPIQDSGLTLAGDFCPDRQHTFKEITDAHPKAAR